MTNFLTPKILYQDQDILVIDKPAGLVTNRANSVKQPTLQDWVEPLVAQAQWPSDWRTLIPANFVETYGLPEDVFALRSGIAHRLDKDTSGIVLVAKHPGSLVYLLQAFRERTVTKSYLCLVHGLIYPDQDRISLPLGRSSQHRHKFAVVPDGRPAITHYQVQRRWQLGEYAQVIDLVTADLAVNKKQVSSNYQGFSLLVCHPETGRTHQIRVHLSSIQHPLVGDATYTGKRRHSFDQAWCARHFLHANSLTVTHPRSGKAMSWESSLPADLSRTLALLD